MARKPPGPPARSLEGERLAALVDDADEPARTAMILGAERRRRGKPARSWILTKCRALSGAWPAGGVTLLAERIESANGPEMDSVAALVPDEAVRAGAREADEDYTARLIARRKPKETG